MSVDIYHSRRTHFRECKYWLPDNKQNRDVIVLTREPAGIFYAKESNAISSGFNPLANVFAVDRNTVMLETNDDVEDMVKGSIVLYLDKSWTVDTIQRQIHNKEVEFNDEIHATTYIGIRR